MFEIYYLVHVDHFVKCPQGSHMANILVVLEKCPLSGKDTDCDQSVHSTRPSSVVLRECPEGIREFPLSSGLLGLPT
jgi:hypothetical protein